MIFSYPAWLATLCSRSLRVGGPLRAFFKLLTPLAGLLATRHRLVTSSHSPRLSCVETGSCLDSVLTGVLAVKVKLLALLVLVGDWFRSNWGLVGSWKRYGRSWYALRAACCFCYLTGHLYDQLVWLFYPWGQFMHFHFVWSSLTRQSSSLCPSCEQNPHLLVTGHMPCVCLYL